MPRLLHDRYFAYDDLHGCDLATGEAVSLDRLPQRVKDAGISGDRVASLAPLIEIFEDARDGDPRWIVADARSSAHAGAMAAWAASNGAQRGFVPVLVPLFWRWREALAAELEERTLLLLGSYSRSLSAARSALVQAACYSPRPHVLLTFRSNGAAGAPFAVREARTAYGVPPIAVRPRATVPSPDVRRIVERAGLAAEFQQAGRHAAAERLLRDVAASLFRRQAFVPAARVLVTLGRMVLERGRAVAADKIFDEAAQHAQSGEDETAMLDARVWQATARTDAARLTDAESMCRAVLLTRVLSPGYQAWATATLARVLLSQGRLDEALSCLWSPQDVTLDIDMMQRAVIEAAAVRVLLATGDIFRAGQRARALMTETEAQPDPLARIIGLTAHLRLLAAAGDLLLANQCLDAIVSLAWQARAPLRTARARLIWYEALQRSGSSRLVHSERRRLTRIRRVAPPLLRRAIDHRLACDDRAQLRVAVVGPTTNVATFSAVSLLRLVQDEDDDRHALERIAASLLRDLQPTRVDLVSCDAGPVSTVMTRGSGLATRLGPRTLEAGFAIDEDVDGGGREIGMPIRLGTRLVAAFVCRWPVDRQPPPQASEVLQLAAAVAAPRADGLLVSMRESSYASTSVPELIGASAAIQEVRRAIERAAKAPFALLIEGESGVGKELAARAVHQLSLRRERRFCDVNCAALPDELLESELFGHARGAFTGAVADKPGLFEEADGGTLFLDEVPDLSPRGQAKLLRVLQQQEVRRVGETFSRKVDVRLVTAANRDMRLEVSQERFRADLLYRLDVIRIRIPPLRERPEDVAVLAHHFWSASAARVECVATLTHELLAALARYHWPGNVRELQNVIAALAVAAPSRGRVRSSLLPAAIAGSLSVTSPRLSEARAQFERRCVEVALARAGGSRTRAAAELGLSRQGLLKTMERLGVGEPSRHAKDIEH